jgi:hypothetical protein
MSIDTRQINQKGKRLESQKVNTRGWGCIGIGLLAHVIKCAGVLIAVIKYLTKHLEG